MSSRSRRWPSLLISLTSGAGAVVLLICTLLGVGTLNCGDGRALLADGAPVSDAPGLDAPVNDGAQLDGPGTHPCRPVCELLNICTGGSSKGSGSGPGTTGWVDKCVTSCVKTYASSTPGSLSGGSSSYRQKIDCGSQAKTCAALDACLK